MDINIMRALRQEMFQKRKQVSQDYRDYHQPRIIQKIMEFSEPFEKIACYYPVNGEIDTKTLWPQLQNKGKKIYLPKTQLKQPLTFLELQSETILYNDLFDIPIPKDPISVCSAQELDLVILPALAADTTGNRVGMGGGYYDRSFAFKKNTQDRTKPLLLCLIWDFQLFEQTFISNLWDVRVDALLTESRFINLTTNE